MIISFCNMNTEKISFGEKIKRIPTEIQFSQIFKGQRRITANTAIRLSTYFENTTIFWLGIQVDLTLKMTQILIKKNINTFQ